MNLYSGAAKDRLADKAKLIKSKILSKFDTEEEKYEDLFLEDDNLDVLEHICPGDDDLLNQILRPEENNQL